MSRIDEDLTALRVKLAALEEQKRIEAEAAAEKKANPVKTLETILTQTRRSVEYHERHKRWHERNAAAGTAEYLEPIMEMLKQIQDRLDVLERRPTPN
jgi:hypothetical protein